MRSHRFVPFAVFLLLAGLSGCEDRPFRALSTSPAERPRITQPGAIRAVLAPDSVAEGQPIVVKVTYYGGGCGWVPDLETRISGDSILVDALLLSVPWVGDCPDYFTSYEEDCRVIVPHAGRWTLVMNALDDQWQAIQLVLRIVVGESPAALRRFDLRFEDPATLEPLPGLMARISQANPRGSPTPVATLSSGPDGQASAVLDCAADTTAYAVEIDSPGYRPYIFNWSPARCGVPERGIYLIRPYPPRPSLSRRGLAIKYR